MKKLLFFILFGVLILRIYFYYSLRTKYPNGTKIRITSKVTIEPVVYDKSQYLKLIGLKIYIPKYPEVNYGDTVVIEGVVVDNKLTDVEVIKIEKSRGFIYNFRNKVIDFYQKSLPQTHASLVAGMTLGSKANISLDFWTVLKNSGTAHVVVASGMNVSLVASFLMGFLVLIFPRRRAIPFALMGIWIYALLSGFEAPIVRAAIMGSFAFVAQELGRIYSAFRALVGSAGTLLIIRPDWFTDLGFILSFVATLSLIIFVPKIERLFRSWPKIVKQDLVTTLSAQIGVAPILYYYFGQFNVFSPIANVLVLWTVVPITILGMVSGIIGTFSEPIGKSVLLLVYPLTSWFIRIVTLFA